MTRKDYQVIANAIHDTAAVCKPDMANTYAILRVLAGRIAFDLAQRNPKFDRARFLAACGVDKVQS